MPEEMRPALELVATRTLPTAVRGRSLEDDPVTYRKSLEDVIPGQLLTIEVRHRWTFRKTTMIGGRLLHVGFSLRALRAVGVALPERDQREGLVDPAQRDPRLHEGLLALMEEDLLGARAELLDVLEDAPGSLGAHCALGHAYQTLRRTVLALAHYTAAVRLGLAAVGTRGAKLDAVRPGPNALLGALAGRARLLEGLGRPEAAAADLRRALRLDPEDLVGAGPRLAGLAAPEPGGAS